MRTIKTSAFFISIPVLAVCLSILIVYHSSANPQNSPWMWIDVQEKEINYCKQGEDSYRVWDKQGRIYKIEEVPAWFGLEFIPGDIYGAIRVNHRCRVRVYRKNNRYIIAVDVCKKQP